jgi:hypothetical protein
VLIFFILSFFEGVISTFAGSGQHGNADGIGTASSFGIMDGIVVDQQTGNLFVCDTTNHKIRKITSQGPSPPLLFPFSFFLFPFAQKIVDC